MKKSAILINTARGGLINEEDLYWALEHGVIAGACLDVLSSEPPQQDHPLTNQNNCIITPHIAWATTASRIKLIRIVADNIKAHLEGSPKNVVN
jgi:glycerate dehydrogenase